MIAKTFNIQYDFNTILKNHWGRWLLNIYLKISCEIDSHLYSNQIFNNIKMNIIQIKSIILIFYLRTTFFIKINLH